MTPRHTPRLGRTPWLVPLALAAWLAAGVLAHPALAAVVALAFTFSLTLLVPLLAVRATSAAVTRLDRVSRHDGSRRVCVPRTGLCFDV